MGIFRRQDSDSARGRTPKERAHAAAVRGAPPRGLPEPPPPASADPEPEPFDVEPVARRVAEPAAVSARGVWEASDEVADDDPAPPHGDPLTPAPPPERSRDPGPDPRTAVR